MKEVVFSADDLFQDDGAAAVLPAGDEQCQEAMEVAGLPPFEPLS